MERSSSGPSERFAVLIPAFDAGGTVEGVVRGALRHAADILVVDDGSRDGSGEAALKGGARVVRHAENRGKGAALATGFARLLGEGAEAIVTLDADGQHDPDGIPDFIEAWRATGADLIVGSRRDAFAAMSGPRRFGNRFSTAAVRLFRGPTLPDTQCGFRLYTRRLLHAAPFRRRAYDAEVEILMRAGIGGFRVASIPIRSPEADGRSTSHYRSWLDTYRICRTVVFYSLVESRMGR